MNKAIGVFDSGVGGLTVLSELRKVLPRENFLYLGDTARVPYGGKGKDTVVRYSFEAAKFLSDIGIKALVVACNTASSLALEELKGGFSLPIFGVVEPGASACAALGTKRVGIIGTKGTVRSGAYQKKLRELIPDVEVATKACPLFVPLVEEGWQDTPVALEIARMYLKELQDFSVDSLILGCTHYPVLEDTLKEALGTGVRLVNPAVETAKRTAQVLDSMKLLREEGKGDVKYYVTDAPEQFVEVGSNIVGWNMEDVRQIRML